MLHPGDGRDNLVQHLHNYETNTIMAIIQHTNNIPNTIIHKVNLLNGSI